MFLLLPGRLGRRKLYYLQEKGEVEEGLGPSHRFLLFPRLCPYSGHQLTSMGSSGVGAACELGPGLPYTGVNQGVGWVRPPLNLGLAVTEVGPVTCVPSRTEMESLVNDLCGWF